MAAAGRVSPGDVRAAGLRERDAAAPARAAAATASAAPAAAARARRGLTAGRRSRHRLARLLHRVDDDVLGAGQRSCALYQKRPSGSQVTFTLSPTTRPFSAGRQHLDGAIVIGRRHHAFLLRHAGRRPHQDECGHEDNRTSHLAPLKGRILPLSIGVAGPMRRPPVGVCSPAWATGPCSALSPWPSSWARCSLPGSSPPGRPARPGPNGAGRPATSCPTRKGSRPSGRRAGRKSCGAAPSARGTPRSRPRADASTPCTARSAREGRRHAARKKSSPRSTPPPGRPSGNTSTRRRPRGSISRKAPDRTPRRSSPRPASSRPAAARSSLRSTRPTARSSGRTI